MTQSRARTAWFDGIPVQVSEFNSLDGKTVAMFNGAGGGSYGSTVGVLSIGGAGVWMTAPLTMSGNGCNVTSTVSTAPIVFGDGDYFEFQATAGRTVFDYTAEAGGVLGFMSTEGNIPVSLQPGTIYTIPLRVHDTATLVSATVYFAVQDTHAGGVPQLMPRARIVRVGPDGMATPLPCSSSDPNGWVSISSPASGTSWYAAAATQTFTIAPSGIALDPSGLPYSLVQSALYSYWLELVDESYTDTSGANTFVPGLSTGNVWAVSGVSLSGIADLRPE